MGSVYAFSIAIFGGSAQFVEQLLINWTGSPMAPAFYMTGAVIVGMVGVLILKEPKGHHPLAPERALAKALA
jgi:hypothetical protein